MTDEGRTEPLSVYHALDNLTTGLDHLIKMVDDRGLGQLDDPSLIGFMQTFERVRNRLSLIDHQIIVDGQRRDLPTAMCQGSMRRVLTSALSLSRSEAARRVRAAEAVGPRMSMLGDALDPVRPRLAAAQRDGQVSAEKVAIIARALGQVDRRGFDPAEVDAGEELLSERASVFPPEDLRLLADRVIDAINPDGTLPNDQLNHDRRYFHLRPTKDGAYVGEFRLTGTAGAKLKTLLDPLARPRLDPAGEIDARTHGQRLHDAVEDLCDRQLRAGDIPDAGGIPATVIVTISLDDLINQVGHGRTADGTLLPIATILHLANSADVIPTVLNASGAVLDLGRTRRIASRPQTLALIARDGGCSFPSCAHPPQYCERHHIRIARRRAEEKREDTHFRLRATTK